MKTTTLVALLFAAVSVAAVSTAGAVAKHSAAGSLPVRQIEQALHAKGTVSNGVLTVEIDRKDLGNRHIHGVVIKPSFQINGTLAFQPLAGGRALFNADLPFKPSEINRFIDALLRNHIVLQAEHQHFYDLMPPTWFMHFRAIGDPVAIAAGVYRAMVSATSIHLPQAPPEHPHTPFDVPRLKRILGASSAQIGSDGVVTVTLTQKRTVRLGGVVLNQNANAETNIAFEPLNRSGTVAAAAPDFGMFAWQVENVIRVMRLERWDVGCLYNQETDEAPQLYFSHDFKTGNPYELAREVRLALDDMNVH